MMQLICNGIALDLLAGASISFSKTNPLFAFDDLACERTQAFELPDTPTNDRVFGLAKIPAYRGDGMRRRFDAQIIAGVVVKNGFLYVDSFDVKKRVYKAVFVCGELVALKYAKDAGKIGEYLTPADYVLYGGKYGTPANDVQRPYEKTRYASDTGADIRPSVSVEYLVGLCAAHFGMSVESVVPFARILNKEVHGIEKSAAITTTAGAGSLVNGVDLDAFDNVIATTENVQVTYFRNNVPITQNVTTLKAVDSFSITFRQDLGVNWFLVALKSGDLYGDFFGDYSFTKDRGAGGQEIYATQGEPLAGRTIEVEAGTRFLLLNSGDYHNMADSGGNVTQGWQFDQYLRYGYTHDVELQQAELKDGEHAFLRYNMPDVTFIDLLKMLAAISGKVLNVNDNTITFDALQVQTWPSVAVDDAVLEVSEVARKFADYAQRNLVRFDSSEAVPAVQRITQAYTIDNDNLERETDLQVVPYSEGRETARNVFACVLIDSIYDNDDKPSVISANPTTSANTYATRVPLERNAGLQALCDASTRIDIRVRMTLAEFEAITPKTLIQYAGTRYVWSAADWQKNAAKFTLNAI